MTSTLTLTRATETPLSLTPYLLRATGPVVNIYPGVDAGPYEVVGNGVHDDGPAFQWLTDKAEAQSASLQLWPCSGGYYLGMTNGWKLPNSGMAVEGRGYDSRIVVAPSQFINVGDGIIRPKDRDSDIFNLTFSNIWIDGPGYLASYGSRAIDLGTHVSRTTAPLGPKGHLWNLRMESVTITNWTGPAIYLENPISPIIDGLYINTCRGGLIVIGESRHGVIADPVIINAHDDAISLSSLTNRTGTLLPDELLLWPEDWDISGAHIETHGNHGIILWGPRNVRVQAKIWGPGSPDPIDTSDDLLPYDASVVGVNVGSAHVLPIQDVTLDVEVEQANGIGVNIAAGFKYPQETFAITEETSEFGGVLCSDVRVKARVSNCWHAGVQLGLYHKSGDDRTEMRNITLDGLDISDAGITSGDNGIKVWTANSQNGGSRIHDLKIRHANIVRTGGAALRFDQNSIIDVLEVSHLKIENPHQFDADGNAAVSDESVDAIQLQGRIDEFEWNDVKITNKNLDGTSRASLVKYGIDTNGAILSNGGFFGLKIRQDHFLTAPINNAGTCYNVHWGDDIVTDQGYQAVAAASALSFRGGRIDGNRRYSVSAGTGTVNTVDFGPKPRVIVLRTTGSVTFTGGGTRGSRVGTFSASADTVTSVAHGLSNGDAVWFRQFSEQPADLTTHSFTVTAADDYLFLDHHGLQNGDALFISSLTGGTGLSAGTVYYVVEIPAATYPASPPPESTSYFKLAATPGGAAIDITLDGSGTYVRNGVLGVPGGIFLYVVNKNTDDFQIALTPGGTPIDILADGTGTFGGGKNIVMDQDYAATSGQEILMVWDGWDAHGIALTKPSPTFGGLTISDGGNIAIGTSTGTRIGSAGSKIGFFGKAPAAKPSAYTPTNVSTDRSYDANATTVDELADILGTLIADLQSIGLIG